VNHHDFENVSMFCAGRQPGLRQISYTASQVTSFLASLWAELGKKLGVSLKLGKLRGILGF
jgi:hypothetical protein